VGRRQDQWAGAAAARNLRGLADHVYGAHADGASHGARGTALFGPERRESAGRVAMKERQVTEASEGRSGLPVAFDAVEDARELVRRPPPTVATSCPSHPRANELYYVSDAPDLSDAEYDRLGCASWWPSKPHSRRCRCPTRRLSASARLQVGAFGEVVPRAADALAGQLLFDEDEAARLRRSGEAWAGPVGRPRAGLRAPLRRRAQDRRPLASRSATRGGRFVQGATRRRRHALQRMMTPT